MNFKSRIEHIKTLWEFSLQLSKNKLLCDTEKMAKMIIYKETIENYLKKATV